VDAGGLGVLLELRQQIQSHGIDFKLMNVNQLIGMVFKITRLDTVFEISSAAELLPGTSQRSRVTLAELASCA
jgi:anti-anti-sigma factor